MSKTIDQRVVEMSFDNKQFETNVQTSMSTIDKLKQSLNFEGISDGFGKITSAVKGTDFSPLSSGINAVTSNFSALQVMAITALANITNSAVNAGKNILSALTIEPIKTGFQEYETQINAIQTILANTKSKGTTMADVTAALDELNVYADKTIYNFTEMTRNIGTFTAAGVGLEESTKAIQGIANLAAISGSTSEQASRGMYQLSQALSSGTVKLMDWNSVVNAGMGGEVFQDALKETARVHGIAIDDIIKEQGSFRTSLSEGWLSSEILLETLDKFTMTTEGLTEAEIAANREKLKSIGYTEEQIDQIFELGTMSVDAATKVKTFTQLFDTLKESAQSGWTKSWEIIVGDFEEAKSTLTAVSDFFGDILQKSADARNEVLQGWKDLGGRDSLIEIFKNLWNAFVSVFNPISEALANIFPPMTAERLYNITKAIENFTLKLALSNEQSAKLRTLFEGLFSVLDIVKMAFSEVWDRIKPLFGYTDDAANGFLDMGESLGEYLKKLRDSIKENDTFGKALDKVTEFLLKAKEKLYNFGDTVKEAYEKAMDGPLGVVVNKVKEYLEKLKVPAQETFQNIWESVKEGWNSVVSYFQSKDFSLSNIFTSIGKTLEQSGVTNFFTQLLDTGKELGSSAVSSLGSFFGDTFQKIATGDYSGLIELINSLSFGGFSAGLFNFFTGLGDTLKSLGSGEMTEGISDLLGSVTSSLESFQNKLNSESIKNIAIAIGILAAALVVMASIDAEKLNSSVGAMAVLLAELTGTFAILNAMSSGQTSFLEVAKSKTKMQSAISALTGIAVSLLILSFALKNLSDMKPTELITGLAGLGGSLALLVESLRMIDTSGISGGGASNLILFAAAIAIFAKVLKDLSSLSMEELRNGLIGLGGVMLELAAFTRLVKADNNLVTVGIGMIAFGAALKIMASALNDFVKIPSQDLTDGLVAMGASLGIVSAALNSLPKNTMGLGAGLIIVGASLHIISSALKSFGAMEWDEMAKGLVAMGGSLLILSVALFAMKNSLAGSAALMVASIALLALAPALKMLGGMSWEEIAKGLVTLAGALAIIGIASALVNPVAILAMAGSMALFGASIIAIGAGLMAIGLGMTFIATGLTALGVAFATGITGIVAGATVLLSGLLSLIPMIFTKIAEGVIAFVSGLASSIDAISDSLLVIVRAMIQVFVEAVPELAEALLLLVTEALSLLVTYTPQIVTSLADFVIGLLDALTIKIPELVDSAMKFIFAFFSAITESLRGIDTTTLTDAVVGFGIMGVITLALGAILPTIPAALLGVLGVGVVIAELAIVLAAIGGLAQIPGLKWLVDEGGDLLEGIGAAIGKLVGGIVGGIAKGITSQLPDIANDLSEFMINLEPFIEGAQGLTADIGSGVKAIADMVLTLTAADILDGLTSWFTGGNTLSSFGDQLADFGPKLKIYADSVKDIKEDDVKASANAGTMLADMAKTLPDTGGKLETIFGSKQSLSDFADQLVLFGPKLKEYSDSVKDIKEDDVKASANAGTMLSEMANTLPDTGGKLETIFGSKQTLTSLGDQLVDFGPKLKTYADSVKDIKEESIAGSSNAVAILAEMANTLPETGGWHDTIFGSQSLSAFADDLVLFGPKLKTYSDSIKDVKEESVTASANAVKMLADIATTLPEMGGGWFSGESNIVKFGDNLVKLGNKLVEYYTAIKDINTTTLSAVIDETSKLITMAKTMVDLDTTVVSSFAKSIGDLGDSGVELFVEAFETATDDVKAAAAGMLQDTIDGADAKKQDVYDKFTSIITDSITKMKTKWQDFKDAGKYLVQGFVAGISENSYLATNQAEAMANATVTAANNILGIHSPSRAFMTVGSQVAFGFASGIEEGITQVRNSSEMMAFNAVESTRNALSRLSDVLMDDIDADPVIRPVLDLSNIQNGVQTINSMFGDRQTAMVNGIMGVPNGNQVLAVSPRSPFDNLDRENGNMVINIYDAAGKTTEQIAQEIGYKAQKSMRMKGVIR